MRSQVNMVSEMTSSDIVILVIVTLRLGSSEGRLSDAAVIAPAVATWRTHKHHQQNKEVLQLIRSQVNMRRPTSVLAHRCEDCRADTKTGFWRISTFLKF